jgi:hypothetical protein
VIRRESNLIHGARENLKLAPKSAIFKTHATVELGNQTEKRTNTDTLPFVHDVTSIAKFTTSRKVRADNIMQSGALQSIHFRQTECVKLYLFNTMIVLLRRSTTSAPQSELIISGKNNFCNEFPKSALLLLFVA